MEELFVSTAPQPTRGSIPQPPRNLPGAEDPLTCHMCGSVEKNHPRLTCWQRRIDELGKTNWELGLIPPTSPSNGRPFLLLRRRNGDIVEELFVSPPMSYRQLALTQDAYDYFKTPPHSAAYTPEQSVRKFSSQPHPQTCRPLETIEEEDSTRSPTPVSRKDVVLNVEE